MIWEISFNALRKCVFFKYHAFDLEDLLDLVGGTPYVVFTTKKHWKHYRNLFEESWNWPLWITETIYASGSIGHKSGNVLWIFAKFDDKCPWQNRENMEPLNPINPVNVVHINGMDMLLICARIMILKRCIFRQPR